jgi:hypothetical protein
MSNSQQDLLSTLFGHWREVAEETTRRLGEESAGVFIYLYNDALDILGAILDCYSNEERLQSLVFAEFTGLLKELHWFHVLFLCGNYRLILSQLRFNWERIFRAQYADAYAEENPGASDAPGPTLDDKHDWLTQREVGLNWPRLIRPTLRRLFSGGTLAQVESLFNPVWDRLNCCVHPSGDLREKLASESRLHVRDAFDPAWARQTLADAAEVFGLIWLAVLSRFPAAVPLLLADPHTFRVCPQLRAVLS